MFFRNSDINKIHELGAKYTLRQEAVSPSTTTATPPTPADTTSQPSAEPSAQKPKQVMTPETAAAIGQQDQEKNQFVNAKSNFKGELDKHGERYKEQGGIHLRVPDLSGDDAYLGNKLSVPIGYKIKHDEGVNRSIESTNVSYPTQTGHINIDNNRYGLAAGSLNIPSTRIKEWSLEGATQTRSEYDVISNEHSNERTFSTSLELSTGNFESKSFAQKSSIGQQGPTEGVREGKLRLTANYNTPNVDASRLEKPGLSLSYTMTTAYEHNNYKGNATSPDRQTGFDQRTVKLGYEVDKNPATGNRNNIYYAEAGYSAAITGNEKKNQGPSSLGFNGRVQVSDQGPLKENWRASVNAHGETPLMGTNSTAFANLTLSANNQNFGIENAEAGVTFRLNKQDKFYRRAEAKYDQVTGKVEDFVEPISATVRSGVNTVSEPIKPFVEEYENIEENVALSARRVNHAATAVEAINSEAGNAALSASEPVTGTLNSINESLPRAPNGVDRSNFDDATLSVFAGFHDEAFNGGPSGLNANVGLRLSIPITSSRFR